MSFDWATFALQLVNVLILLALLRHFLFRPVAAIIARRQAESAAAVEAATRARAEAEAAQAAARAEAEASATARQALLDKAQAEAAKARVDLLEQARAEAAQIIAEGRTALASEAAASARAQTRAACDLALAIVTRALSAQPDGLDGYAARLAQAITAMDPVERAALLAAPNLRIVLPHEPSDAERGTVSAALAPLGIDAPLVADPSLVAGIELQSDSGAVLNSLRHDIQTIAEALDDGRQTR
ncbi:ATPase [Thetidibacter halocola]|uniref:ATP synthase subunit b n=1 Tax=Thetidibacter halocola TaxID=2827239 RepID=A0A8J7WJ89_9RHOB|nr:ATPase [Thetidibacter halocola]MBS0126024.1 ATPase [Thetidibacter halocola]